MNDAVKIEYYFRDKRCYAYIYINNIEIHNIECDNKEQAKKLAVEYLFDLLGDVHHCIYNTPKFDDIDGVMLGKDEMNKYSDSYDKIKTYLLYIEHLELRLHSVNEKIKLGEMMQHLCSARCFFSKMERYIYSLAKNK